MGLCPKPRRSAGQSPTTLPSGRAAHRPPDGLPLTEFSRGFLTALRYRALRGGTIWGKSLQKPRHRGSELAMTRLLYIYPLFLLVTLSPGLSKFFSKTIIARTVAVAFIKSMGGGSFEARVEGDVIHAYFSAVFFEVLK